jgi:Arc/MetJ-type ribon-helix-helix transcriptional regulator
VSTKTRSALRATLKQEDAALEERLPEASPPPATQPEAAVPAETVVTPVTPATAAADARAPVAPAPAEPTAPDRPAVKAKPEKRKHERFKLAASDRRRLSALRDDLKAAGRRPSKSELVRAGLAALTAQGTTEVLALVDTLSPSTRPQDKKARRAKGKKAGSKRKGKSASKKR